MATRDARSAAAAWRLARRHPKTSVIVGAILFLTAVGAAGGSAEDSDTRNAADSSALAAGRAAPKATPTAAAPEPAAAPVRPASARPTPVAPKPAAVPAVRLPAGDDGVVDRHVDGDTLVVSGVKVRLIGIDTPEVHSGVECFGQQASAATAGLLPVGQRVRLVYDVERLDRYGRTLAYVIRSRDGLHVNLQLARTGFAEPLTVPPNVAYAETFAAAARQARGAKLGLWSACAEPAAPPVPAAKPVAPPPAAPPAPQPAARAPESATGSCDPSYPDVCIPSGPDLDCPEISHRRFRVVGADPHRFDADKDGIGCESD